jgi:hypothetical protein
MSIRDKTFPIEALIREYTFRTSKSFSSIRLGSQVNKSVRPSVLLFFTMGKGFQVYKKVDIEQIDTPLRI